MLLCIGHSAVLRTLPFGSLNRAYLALCLRSYAQIQQSWASDTLEMLDEMYIWR